MSDDTNDTEALRARINAYAPYVGAEIEVTRIAPDATSVEVRMPLTERNQNLVGTHFGGSLYAMVDPHLVVLLVRRLGPEYEVWDQAAHIHFEKPGRGTVYAKVEITDDELRAIRWATEDGSKHLPEWTIVVTDDEDAVVATVRKTLYVRRREESES